MKGNNSQPSTPTGLFPYRGRLQSANSPFISPIPIIQSPFINQHSFLDGNGNGQGDFHQFKLEDDANEPPLNEVMDQSDEELSFQCPPLPPHNDENLKLDENNMLQFILRYINRDTKKLDQARDALQDYGSEFNKKLFDFLVGKLKKLKKTKEEMVKYCVRKSFKHIMTKMRSANKAAYINMQNNEVVAEYFQMHCEGDESISMPFKKNSEEKTMNYSFLKKIFKCRQFNHDYKEFLRQFAKEYNSDNNKKIKSMNEAIKKAAKSKCFKGLDEFKRIPWSYEILTKIHTFAKELLEHSPYRNKEKKEEFRPEKEAEEEDNSFLGEQLEMKFVQKKSVIILTPPFKPKAEDPIQPQSFFD